MMKEHEKFWAFCILVGAVVGLVAIVQIWPPEKDTVARMIDAANGGLILALGVASQALFRIGSPADERIKEATAENIAAQPVAPGLPQKVEIAQPPGKPVPTHEAPAAPTMPTPPMFRGDA